MRIKPELDPEVDDLAPSEPKITTYDERHFVTYMRLLDADADRADWREVATIVLHRDPVADECRTHACWESHLARAQWMTHTGYRCLLEQAAIKAQHRPH
ncbi:DUF2285 domain-containing protein [Sphingomonas endophytica]|uniref:T6SS Transcription factor RovC-like DNA binding domain-containing protein n=1 Tax=Sphingomonas endophytica TaxID=869719 RepID=A0ABR6N1N4_9SPHN|nr:DUF2285 domain-containing protein [Sphingomonas endophytica]MBB5724671.1 hypothetical protein [Sphingomonas endophytica]